MTATDDHNPEPFPEAPAAEQPHCETNDENLTAIEGFAEVEKLIRVSKAKIKTIVLAAGGERVEIRVLSAIPLPLRVKIERFFKDTSSGKSDVAASAPRQAELMAALCLDAPWTNPGAWLAIDRATGYLDTAFTDAWAAILDVEGTISKFRPKG